MRTGRAFTFVELLAVLAIMAVLYGAVSFAARDKLDESRLLVAIDQVVLLDHAAREQAMQWNRPVDWTVDVDGNQYLRAFHDEAQDAAHLRTPPRGVRVADVQTLIDDENSGASNVIRISTRGYSPTYAVRLVRGKQSAWVLFCGLSGQTVILNDEEELRHVRDAMSEARHDAH
ncbi:MAG: type II secretion system protein [Phycisphaeraceae bacterium]|nr:type II secretion system protein [Phycisphaeraceae bacterium]